MLPDRHLDDIELELLALGHAASVGFDADVLVGLALSDRVEIELATVLDVQILLVCPTLKNIIKAYFCLMSSYSYFFGCFSNCLKLKNQSQNLVLLPVSHNTRVAE